MILTIILLIVILGLCIFVHELGHFFSAKKMGVTVEEFGFGYPPRIFGIKRKGTIYSINWIPIGGFVKLKGEQGESKKDKDSFGHKKIWQRAIILSSGVVMNFILAFILISIGFSLGLPSVIDDNISSSAHIRDVKIQILEVTENSPAERAELKMGDIIVSVDGQSFIEIDDFQNYKNNKIDQEMNLKIKRGGEEIEKTIIPKDLENKGQGMIGAYLVQTGLVSYPIHESIWMGIKTTVSVTWLILKAIYEIIRNLVISQQVAADIAGPVGIAVLTGQVAKMGFIYILQFTALLSINLAIINFIPFPALDGGRVLFLVIEKIRGKAINQKIESLIHNIGFFLLILILVLVTFRDISRFSSTIREFFQKIF